MTNRKTLCVVVFCVIAPAIPSQATNITLSDEGLMLLDWYEHSFLTAVVNDRKDIPGSGVEFDIYFPGNDGNDDSIYYVSSQKGGSGVLTGIDVSAYDYFELKFTLSAINGNTSPTHNGQLVVGSLIGKNSSGGSYSYKPEVISFAAGKSTNAISSTTIESDSIYQIGIHAHFLTPSGWDPNGQTVTLLVEPVPGDVAIPESTSLLLLAIGGFTLLKYRRR